MRRMKALFLTLTLCCVTAAFSQTVDTPEGDKPATEGQQQAEPPATPEASQPQQSQGDQQNPQDNQPPQANRTAIDVKPGGEALKSKDFYERTGYMHPFVRM